MFKFLTAFLPPWLNPQLIGTISLCLLSAAISGWAVHKLGQAPLLRAQNETLAVQARYDGYRHGVLANVAAANAKAAAEQAAHARRESELQAQLQTAQRDRDAKSRQYLAALKNAKPGDVRPVGPAASAYYDGLRQP